MAAEEFSVRAHSEGGGVVVEVCGEVDLATAPQLSDALLAATAESLDVSVDLSATSLIDSTGISALLTCFKDVRDKGGSFRVRALSPAARKVFEIAGLLDVLGVPPEA
jgi:anti-sigma B factor antagonist